MLATLVGFVVEDVVQLPSLELSKMWQQHLDELQIVLEKLYQILSYPDFIPSRFYFVQILFHPILSYLVHILFYFIYGLGLKIDL